ncbi:MAG: hypothetical protein HY940_08380 [Gammaproteobacteria bacterium]|nr:hypothetical protein [Gammaproteobacteria bacterium]
MSNDPPQDPKRHKDADGGHQAFRPSKKHGSFIPSADGRVIPHRKARFLRPKEKLSLWSWLRSLFGGRKE